MKSTTVSSTYSSSSSCSTTNKGSDYSDLHHYGLSHHAGYFRGYGLPCHRSYSRHKKQSEEIIASLLFQPSSRSCYSRLDLIIMVH